jgi:hypothetical protein
VNRVLLTLASQDQERSHQRQRPGRDVGSRWSAGTGLSCYAGAASFDDHLNSVPSIHIRCRMTASFRATATLALRSPIRFASGIPQALSVDHFAMRVSKTLAASLIAPERGIKFR